MPDVEVDLPDRIDGEIDRLVEQGEFLNRERAIEELITMGMTAYDTTEDTPPEEDEQFFGQAVEDQRDPAMHDQDLDDEYTL